MTNTKKTANTYSKANLAAHPKTYMTQIQIKGGRLVCRTDILDFLAQMGNLFAKAFTNINLFFKDTNYNNKTDALKKAFIF